MGTDRLRAVHRRRQERMAAIEAQVAELQEEKRVLELMWHLRRFLPSATKPRVPVVHIPQQRPPSEPARPSPVPRQADPRRFTGGAVRLPQRPSRSP